MKKFIFIAILALMSVGVSSYGYSYTRTVAASYNNNSDGSYAFKSPIIIMSDFLAAWRTPSLAYSFTERPWGWVGTSSGTGLYGYYGPTPYATSNGLWSSGKLYTVTGTQMATGGECTAVNRAVAQTAFTLYW